jgi:2,4-dienoyl-CoA reductase-like NADH-dependent reductase (Old Yellow Enzyme family)
MELFEKANIGTCELNNRIIRSATFEGMCDENGIPTEAYLSFYKELSKNQIGGIITGFTYISNEGKAMQPGQAGIYSEKLIPHFKKVSTVVHNNGSYIFMQLAHTGRQTRKKETKEDVVGVSKKRSPYFKGNPKKLNTDQVNLIIEKFGDSANFARKAGFDGIQLHAAHGYLIHQFILPELNNRHDLFGIDPNTNIGTKFIDLAIDNIRHKCGDAFPIIVKVSGSDDYARKFTGKQFINLIMFLNIKNISAIEISYGTMDYALNIFRGDMPVNLILSKNKVFKSNNTLLNQLRKIFIFPLIKKKLIPFSPMFNLDYASLAKQYSHVPIISVGGFRKRDEMEYAVKNKGIDFISLCRPFICEPDFVLKIASNANYSSKCKNCNYCAIMCDSDEVTQCYKNKSNGNS